MKVRNFLKFIVLFSLLFACGSRHAFLDSKFPSRAAKLGDVNFNYRIYLPPNMKEGEKLPVMLYLHGSNRRGDDNLSQVEDLAEVIQGFPQNFQFIVVFPQCPEDAFWGGPMLEQALAALDQTVKEFNGDESRLYLAGYSMGGFGTWQMAIAHPTKFAALVPVAGGIEPLGEITAEDRAILSPQVTAAAAAPDPYKAYAEALAKTPVWIVHGNKDAAVPVEQSRKIVEALKSAGDADVNYNELVGVGHGSVVAAFSNAKLFEWLAKQHLLPSGSTKLDVQDEVVYAVLLEDLVYRQDRAFGTDLGKLILIKQDTVAPEDTEILRSVPDLDATLVSDFLDKNKTPVKIRGEYDAKVAHKPTQSKKSLEDIFIEPRTEKLPVGGVLTLSQVGFNEDRTQSLVYVEFYNSSKGLIKKYCRLSWKREGPHYSRGGAIWY